MNQARYLIRFDDICPTMNWKVWDQFEAILVENKIKPILAVVPNNRDEHLVVMPPRGNFWDLVRKWQKMGWTIALHGYEHRYETHKEGLIGINKRSEFAGLPRDVQRDKLRKAFDVFKKQDVRVDAWVAPGHSFDALTVELLLELGLDVISDGYFWRPVRSMGALWIPQQLWRFRPFPGGIWTVCHHINDYSDVDIERFAKELSSYRNKITSLDEVLSANRVSLATIFDHIFARVWSTAVKAKRALRWHC